MYALIHIFLVLVPGFLIATLLGIRRQQLLFSVGFSFACLIVLVSLARNYIWDSEIVVTAYLILVSLLFAWLLLYCRVALKQQLRAIQLALMDSSWVIGVILVIAIFVGWYIYTGPYAEVPADLYLHLDYIKYQYGFLQHGNFGPPLSLWQLANQMGGFWYVLLAMSQYLSGEAIIDMLYPAALINSLLFVLAVYVFSDRLFQVFPLSLIQRRVAVVLTCCFVMLQMGVTVFSYIRYYAMAPTILNMVVYFAAMVCLMDLLGQNDASNSPHSRIPTSRVSENLNSGIILLLFFGIALVMHNQEALFILLMVIATVFWLLIDRTLFVSGLNIKRVVIVGCGVALVFIVALTGLVVAFGSAEIPKPVTGKVVALPFGIPGFGPLHILNPYFQFAQVVTVWGGLVGVIFVAWLSFFRQQPILMAGMIMPFLTVFNPVFVDLYLRMEGDLSLWRLCFLIPLYPVAGLVIIRGIQQWKIYKLAARASVMSIIAALVILPLPISPLNAVNQHQRLINFRVDSNNSYHLWLDLLEQLNSMDEGQRILTDPVTGYVISALTPHQTFRYKFFASEIYHAFSFVFDHYENFPLSRYRNWIIIINQRDGSSSQSGRLSGHWPESIMKVSKYYPENLIQHIKQHPDRFKKIWQGEQIAMYQILR